VSAYTGLPGVDPVGPLRHPRLRGSGSGHSAAAADRRHRLHPIATQPRDVQHLPPGSGPGRRRARRAWPDMLLPAERPTTMTAGSNSPAAGHHRRIDSSVPTVAIWTCRYSAPGPRPTAPGAQTVKPGRRMPVTVRAVQAPMTSSRRIPTPARHRVGLSAGSSMSGKLGGPGAGPGPDPGGRCCTSAGLSCDGVKPVASVGGGRRNGHSRDPRRRGWRQWPHRINHPASRCTPTPREVSPAAQARPS